MLFGHSAQVRMRPDGVCLSCLSDACKLPFDIVAAAVMELEEVVTVTAHGTGAARDLDTPQDPDSAGPS